MTYVSKQNRHSGSNEFRLLSVLYIARAREMSAWAGYAAVSTNVGGVN